LLDYSVGDPVDVLGSILLVLFLLAALGWVYVLPAFVAFKRRHLNRRAILVVNLLLGWTTIGWVVAMVWAFIGDVEAPQSALTADIDAEEPAQAQQRASQAGWILVCLGFLAACTALIVFWR
jgi:Superinfection immunity protein